MNPAAKDTKDMLVADTGLSLVYGTDLFVSKEPTKPNECVTIFDTPSFPSDLTLDGESYFRSSIQVRVRTLDYEAGMALAWTIMGSLHGRANETWNGTLYTVIKAVGEPTPLYYDENNRLLIITNFNLQRR